MVYYIRLLRINNWVKNLTVFLPVFFAGKLLLLDNSEWKMLLLTFVTFCFSSSLVYIINDTKDVEKDRIHPQKAKRPIASGNVSVNGAILFGIILFFLIISLLFFLPKNVSFYVGTYIIMNIFYCFGMKNIAIVDVTSISLGFVYRVLAGGEATQIFTTHWIIILVFLLMFSVSLAKRRDDLVLSGNTNEVYRKSQSGYTLPFIDIAKTISFAVTLVSYIIYSVSDDVVQRMGSKNVYVTSLPVFLGIMRYIQLTVVYEKSGSPVDLFLKDKFLIMIILIWVLLFISILYV